MENYRENKIVEIFEIWHKGKIKTGVHGAKTIFKGRKIKLNTYYTADWAEEKSDTYDDVSLHVAAHHLIDKARELTHGEDSLIAISSPRIDVSFNADRNAFLFTVTMDIGVCNEE